MTWRHIRSILGGVFAQAKIVEGDHVFPCEHQRFWLSTKIVFDALAQFLLARLIAVDPVCILATDLSDDLLLA